MSRRAVLSIAVLCLLILAGAAVPWTLSSGGLVAIVTSHVKTRYGIDLQVSGRSTFAVLPSPRIKFEQISLRHPATSLAAEGGTLRAEIAILPLFAGRIVLGDISLSETLLRASRRAVESRDWNGLLNDASRRASTDRLVVTRSSLRWDDGPAEGLDDIDTVIVWSGMEDTLSLAGSARYRGETITIGEALVQPRALATGNRGRLVLSASLPASELKLSGIAQAGDDPRFKGKSSFKTASWRNFARWSGLEAPFGSLLRSIAVEGDLSFDRRGLSWPSVTLRLGRDAVEGTLAVRLDSERPLLTGTLAADDIDLSDLVMPIAQATTSSGMWSEDTVDLSRTTASDLDLRFSASSARLQRVRLDDMAASVQVRPGRIEVTLGRGTFHDGTLKGRMSLITTDTGAEFRAQGAFEKVDMAAFLLATGQNRWIQGPGQGQFVIEGAGKTPGEMVRRAVGRAVTTIKDGELIGIGLGDAIRRVEKRPLAASLNWKGGRTAFDQAHVQFNVSEGVAELVEGRLTAPELVTTLRGRIFLADRRLDLKVDVAPVTTAPSGLPALGFDVMGRWQDVIVTPDASSFIRRSGAARRLFGPVHPLSKGGGPLATAQ